MARFDRGIFWRNLRDIVWFYSGLGIGYVIWGAFL